MATNSLERKDGRIQERSISRQNLNLTMQRKSVWALAENGVQTALEQRYETALIAHLGEALTQQDSADLFYGKYLQGQISTYVDKGGFVKNMGNLVAQLNTSGTVPAQTLDSGTAGATDDVYIIELERNVPQRIRMFIWLEGQDIDCVDSVSSARFAVSIELAGGDQ